MKLAKILTMAAALVAMSASAQKLPWQNAANSASGPNQQLVHFLYPQQVTVKAGQPQTIELHFRIADGLHINSHTPRQKSLIRTELIEAEPTGVNIAAVDFPPGSDFAFPADPSQKLSIYSGEFVLTMHLVAQKGNHLLQGSLRYQACDNSTCFPPRNVPVPVDVIAN
ncbi:MAG TPA: protein-disulfide reductase DsbD domain-containing protein [Acidobacteriaceae bacterium]